MEAEITSLVERRKRQKAEKAYKRRRDAVEEHYNRLKSQNPSGSTTPGEGDKPGASKDPLILPTLAEFRKQPIIAALQQKPGTEDRMDISRELKSSKLVESTLRQSLETWREEAREKLAGALGFPGWKTASKTKLHPVDRGTALFICRKCNPQRDGNEHKKKSLPQSLDFAGVCGHRCPALSKKQRYRELWTVEQFVPDQKVRSDVQSGDGSDQSCFRQGRLWPQ